MSVLVIMIVSCNRSTGPAEEAKIVKTPVTVTPVIYKSISETVDLPAVSSYLKKNIIKSKTAGSVESLIISLGENVHPNQLLFTIKTREADAIQNSFSKDSSLLFNGIIKIFSPKEGVISSISHQKGDYVQEGDELAVISEQNSLVFILDIPFELNRYIEKNIKCEIILPDNRRINGSINVKLPVMNVQSQTLQYIITPFINERLPENLIASVYLLKGNKQKALVLPKPALLSNETETEFWVMKLINDSTAVKVPVKKGIENMDEIEITEPEFLESDRIILTGNYELPDTAGIVILKK
jgi:biotin carboxyl carrier protein